MHIKTIASAAAISVALGLGSFAYAQDAAAPLPMKIGNQDLTEADAQRVKVHCDDLQTAANQAEGVEGADAEGQNEADTDASDSQAEVGTVDLVAITLELCVEAGFLEGPAM